MLSASADHFGILHGTPLECSFRLRSRAIDIALLRSGAAVILQVALKHRTVGQTLANFSLVSIEFKT